MKPGFGRIQNIFMGGGSLPEWAKSPYFALPSTGVSLIVGQEVTIYGDSLINVPIDNDLTVTYTCDIGTQSGNNFVIDPVDGNIGNHTLTIVFRNAGRIITIQVITLSVFPLAKTVTKKILMVGDSLVHAGMANNYYQPKFASTLTNCTITWLGTQDVGDGYPHEGHDGFSWGIFANNSAAPTLISPFFKAGVLNIGAYFTDNSIATPNYVVINLGVNDVFGQSNPSGDGLTVAELATIIVNAKKLVDGFLAFDPNLKIIIGLPPSCDSTGAAWIGLYGTTRNPDLHIENTQKLRSAYVTTFANGVYNLRVDCSYEQINLDRDNGYPKTGGVHTNDVHPNKTGYEQLAVGMAMKLNQIIYQDVIRDGNTAAWFIADELTTITKDGGNQVSLWKDYLNSGNDIAQSNASYKPTWSLSGISFTGNDFLRNASIASLIQPTFIYMVVRQDIFSDAGIYFDGNTINYGALKTRTVDTDLSGYAGTYLVNSNNNLGSFLILRVLWNGANSSIQVNETAKIIGDAGTRNMDGITIGASGTGDGYYGSKITVKEAIFRNINDSAIDETVIYNYLKAKYSL